MKKEATLKRKGLKKIDPQRKRGNPKTQGAQKEGEGDAFWFKSKSCTKVTHQTKNQRTVSSLKAALPN
jgi:hypothetical protein